MKKYKEVNTITTIDENNEIITNTIIKLHTIKTWDDLTREEKENEIQNRSEAIYSYYQDELYYIFKDELGYIKEKYKNINFDDVYIDSNSQGWWIDSVKHFKYYNNITVYDEQIEVDGVDLHIGKYIYEVTEDDVNVYDYYIDDEKLEKIRNSKKYKKWINEIIKDVNNWIDEINQACKDIASKEYCYPYNLDDPDDKDWLDDYFNDEEFEEIEVIQK